MCGIAGIYLFKNYDIDVDAAVKVMLDKMEHRGPDARSTVRLKKNNNVIGCLGHTRLSIRDLDARANQPYILDDVSLVYNGEIYNEALLMEMFSIDKRETTSDTEVIAACLNRGEARYVANELDGMFAFASFHERVGNLYLARDRFSQKPLYYYLDDEKIIFASEIRALMACQLFPVIISNSGLVDFLEYGHSISDLTLIDNVKMLKAGHLAKVSQHGVIIEEYTKVYSKHSYSKSKIKEKFRELLMSSVERQMVSDVKLGVYLSGGLDSSVVAAISKKVNPNVETISLVFPELSKQDNYFSKKVAGYIGSKHIEIPVHYEDFVLNITDYIRDVDSPSYDGLNSYVISKLAKGKGFTVCLSGLGGDEYFGGYYTFNLYRKMLTLAKLPRFLRKTFAKTIHLVPKVEPNKKYLLRRLLMIENTQSLGEYHKTVTSIFSPEQIDMLVKREKEEKSNYPNESLSLETIAKAEMSFFMGDQLLRDGDQTSMAVSLETRFPLLDLEVLKFVNGLESHVRFDKIPKKQFMYDCFKDMLPENFLDRKKEGFSLPMHSWTLQYAVPNLNQLIQDSELKSIVPIDFNSVKKVVDDFANQKNKHLIRWSHVWSLFILFSWIKNNLCQLKK